MGTENLVRIDGKMNAAKQKETLDPNLLASSRKLKLGSKFIFQQDNGPKHTARGTMERLQM